MGGPDETGSGVEEQCSRVLHGLLTGEAAADLTDDLADGVLVWSPRIRTSCREDLLLSLEDGLVGCDSLTEVEVAVTDIEVSGPRISLEWQLTGRFTEVHFVDDDVLVEPTNERVEVRGRLVAIRVEAQIAALTCSFEERESWPWRARGA